MKLSKSSDFIPLDLLIIKHHYHGISLNATTFIYSCLKHRKNNVKILVSFPNLIHNFQDSILRSISFNIFLYDLLAALTKSLLYNFVDDNNISSYDDLLKISKEELQSAVKWFSEIIYFQILINSKQK